MIEILKTKKYDSLKIINDVIHFNDLFLIRTLEKLTAISSDSHEIIWEIELKGETLINLDSIFLVENVIITFSYSREEDKYFIYGINNKGELIWSTTSDYQPNGKHAVCVKKDKLIYNGYSSNFTNTLIIEIDPINGELKTLVDLKTNSSYLSNINDNLILLGSSGIYLLGKDYVPEKISEDFIVSIIASSDKDLKYISQSGEKGSYNVIVLDDNLNTKILGTIDLDSSDRGNMFPILNGEKLISFKGEEKGVAYTDLSTGSEIWHIGDNELSGISVKILNDNTFVLLHDDIDFNTNMFIYNLGTGDLIQKTDFKGISSKIFYLNNTLIAGSSRGMHIYDLSKN